ncbi:unnamed protein product [Vicia faba]|uniref:Uncharacterized protein n=1 Tax=Vicia faba TaxID=3906 RepID=A0AAV1B7R2_VICFA|nr:unnamed protein product [Vicia faba]
MRVNTIWCCCDGYSLESWRRKYTSEANVCWRMMVERRSIGCGGWRGVWIGVVRINGSERKWHTVVVVAVVRRGFAAVVGAKTEHSGTTEHANNSSVNLIGAHSNGFHSYQSKFPPEFLNIQKKRRTEKGKTSNTHITSSVNTKNGVPPIFAPEDAQVHPYASNNSSWMYGLGYNAAVCRIINESRENHMHSTQTFDEFKLSLRRMAEISLLPNQTCDYNSLMRIRNCIEPNYNAKQLDYSDWQTIREAERPQTCTDVLVEDMHVSCAKKKRSRKRSVLSSSMRPNKDEMQQCHNSALGNHQLTLGKPSGTARRVVQKITYNVEALTEQFRQLNINTGGKELALYGQTALVPFQGSFDPIKKQRPRPKVNLDEETDRVWKLLLLDINHDGVDGTNEEKWVSVTVSVVLVCEEKETK